MIDAVRQRWGRILTNVAIAGSTSLCIVVGVIFAHAYVVPCADAGGGPALLDCFSRWDGRSYAAILTEGYRYDAGERSQIAFFPLYPLLGKAVRAATGWPATGCLLCVSWVSLVASLVLLGEYAALKDRASAVWVVLATACLPAGFFLRMAYTESTCLLLLVGTACVIARGGSLWAAAILAGACSGSRSVGVAAAAAAILYAFAGQPTWRRALLRAAACAPVSLWGVIAFSAYQGFRYHDPFAFVKIQDTYRMRPSIPLGEKVIKLLTLEPLWAAYVPSSTGFWSSVGLSTDNSEALFNMPFWNPIYFVLAALLVIAGAFKRMLSRYELVIAFCLLFVPYVTRGYDFGMGSQARFAVLCFPATIVLGRLLDKNPGVWRVIVILPAVLQMTFWAALFGEGYPLF